MKCYFTYDPVSLKKVLIPMCYSTCDTRDIRDCTCSPPLTVHYFEKERYNKVLNEKNDSIESMEAELKHLRKIIAKHKMIKK